jgi:hypothetical protein
MLQGGIREATGQASHNGNLSLSFSYLFILILLKEDQAQLPYLDCVIKEMFRLCPPAPLGIPHQAERDCTIGGYKVDKGSIIIKNCTPDSDFICSFIPQFCDSIWNFLHATRHYSHLRDFQFARNVSECVITTLRYFFARF